MNERIYDILASNKLDALFISSQPNIAYLTGYPSRESYLLVSQKENIYFTDSRYTAEARRCLKDCVVKQYNGAFYKTIAEACNKLKFKRIGFEERYLPFAEYAKIEAGLSASTEFIPVNSLVEELRKVKSPEELCKIRKAAQITVKTLQYINNIIKPGIKEIELAGEIEHFIRHNGAMGAAFEIIVASGPNSSFPHHLTSQKKIKRNEPVLIDMGINYEGYKSDLTRVFFLGKMESLLQRIYSIVLSAHDAAIEKIKPGIKAQEIDLTARNLISKEGFGEFFGHALGHGVGLEVHEGPSISKRSNEILEEAMVFTVEPGIYLPGKFGVRFEDTVIVTKKGCEVLNGALN